MSADEMIQRGRRGLGRLFGSSGSENENAGPSKWSMGVLNDKETAEVPGSVLLLASDRNEPLGLHKIHARISHSSVPAGFPMEMPMAPGGDRRLSTTSATQGQADETRGRKRTEDGKIILEPQPGESANDPLNWPSWRRDCALLSLGFYCMIGGGMTPAIAAGFTEVAHEYNVSVESVALTTGLFMMGMGLGSVIASPTAILFGKRPVYLVGSIVFIATSLWAAFSPSFPSLMAARVFQGIAVSPVECLPSATIAEIFFLHERAYRIGIYTLLLLGGKNLVPLVSATIIGRFGWRWVFRIVAMTAAFGFVLLFLFVPETFWDRTPTRRPSRRSSCLRRLSSRHAVPSHKPTTPTTPERSISPGATARNRDLHVGFEPAVESDIPAGTHAVVGNDADGAGPSVPFSQLLEDAPFGVSREASLRPTGPPDHELRAPKSPYTQKSALGSTTNVDLFSQGPSPDHEKMPASRLVAPPKIYAYTHNLRQQPARTFVQQLKPYHGRLSDDNWFKAMVRPFILFAYPAVLWSAAIYSCSIGWLIVISETLAVIYRNPNTYNFTALQTGLVYISPFVGGVLGTGVAGKVSDILVRAMARRNGGLYEPEFRLIMAAPVLVTTCAGLMGFGWSAQQTDSWVVPTIFFGIVSFGCSLGSTTAITFCVDSYRQYAGEALVTLNFCKNIFHGLVFSLFVSHWLAEDGSKSVYIWLGVIQLVVCLCSIPMYVFGKRARMWTVRMKMMEQW